MTEQAVMEEPQVEEKPKEITKEEKVKAALDAVSFVKDELLDFVGPDFWEEVIRLATVELGLEQVELPPPPEEPKEEMQPIPPMEPMEEKNVKIFMEELIPYGKYVGQKISTVLKKDRAALDHLAYKPHLFQTRLKRFLLAVPVKTKEKESASKKAPKKKSKKGG